MSISEKRDELADDALDKMSQFMEQWNDQLTLDNLRLAERYLKGELELLVFFSLKGQRPAKDFCAILQKNGFRPHPYGLSFPPSCNSQLSISGCHRYQEAVLVDVVQFMDSPQVIVPSFVRAAFLDELYCGARNPLYFGIRTGFQFLKEVVGSGSTLEDWITDVSRGHISVSLNELPNEMIEGGSQIVKNISDEDRKSQGDLRAEMNPIDFLARFQIALGTDGIRTCFDERINPAFEIVDVFFGPFDFCPNAG